MESQKLDYESPGSRKTQRAKKAPKPKPVLSMSTTEPPPAAALACVLFVINALLVGLGWGIDDGFRKMGFEKLVVPIVNGIAFVFSLALSGVVKREAPNWSIGPYVAVAVLGPILGILIDPVLMQWLRQ